MRFQVRLPLFCARDICASVGAFHCVLALLSSVAKNRQKLLAKECPGDCGSCQTKRKCMPELLSAVMERIVEGEDSNPSDLVHWDLSSKALAVCLNLQNHFSFCSLWWQCLKTCTTTRSTTLLDFHASCGQTGICHNIQVLFRHLAHVGWQEGELIGSYGVQFFSLTYRVQLEQEIVLKLEI